jgi:hypothetical protein
MYDIVQNPIPKNDFFVTEDNLTELFNRIEGMSNKQEKAQAYQIAFMVLNTCHKIVNEKILSKEIFAQ